MNKIGSKFSSNSIDTSEDSVISSHSNSSGPLRHTEINRNHENHYKIDLKKSTEYNTTKNNPENISVNNMHSTSQSHDINNPENYEKNEIDEILDESTSWLDGTVNVRLIVTTYPRLFFLQLPEENYNFYRNTPERNFSCCSPTFGIQLLRNNLISFFTFGLYNITNDIVIDDDRNVNAIHNDHNYHNNYNNYYENKNEKDTEIETEIADNEENKNDNNNDLQTENGSERTNDKEFYHQNTPTKRRKSYDEKQVYFQNINLIIEKEGRSWTFDSHPKAVILTADSLELIFDEINSHKNTHYDENDHVESDKNDIDGDRDDSINNDNNDNSNDDKKTEKKKISDAEKTNNFQNSFIFFDDTKGSIYWKNVFDDLKTVQLLTNNGNMPITVIEKRKKLLSIKDQNEVVVTEEVEESCYVSAEENNHMRGVSESVSVNSNDNNPVNYSSNDIKEQVIDSKDLVDINGNRNIITELPQSEILQTDDLSPRLSFTEDLLTKFVYHTDTESGGERSPKSNAEEEEEGEEEWTSSDEEEVVKEVVKATPVARRYENVMDELKLSRRMSMRIEDEDENGDKINMKNEGKDENLTKFEIMEKTKSLLDIEIENLNTDLMGRINELRIQNEIREEQNRMKSAQIDAEKEVFSTPEIESKINSNSKDENSNPVLNSISNSNLVINSNSNLESTPNTSFNSDINTNSSGNSTKTFLRNWNDACYQECGNGLDAEEYNISGDNPNHPSVHSTCSSSTDSPTDFSPLRAGRSLWETEGSEGNTPDKKWVPLLVIPTTQTHVHPYHSPYSSRTPSVIVPPLSIPPMRRTPNSSPARSVRTSSPMYSPREPYSRKSPVSSIFSPEMRDGGGETETGTETGTGLEIGRGMDMEIGLGREIGLALGGLKMEREKKEKERNRHELRLNTKEGRREGKRERE